MGKSIARISITVFIVGCLALPVAVGPVAAENKAGLGATVTITEPILDYISIQPDNPSLVFGEDAGMVQFWAEARYFNGHPGALPADLGWESSNTGVATINEDTGLAAILGTGSTTITAGYQGKWDTTVLTVLPDTIAPVVTLRSPVEGQVLGDIDITIDGIVDDQSAAVTVTVNEESPKTVPLVNGIFGGPVLLRPGSNTIRVDAVDGSGNTGTSGTVTVTVDPSRPGITMTLPKTGTKTNNASQLVTGIVSGNVSSAHLVLNGVSQTVAVAGGSFSTTITLADGENILAVYAYDGGHEGDDDYLGTSGIHRVMLDTTPPVITITEPLPGSTYRSSAWPAIKGRVDDLGVTEVTIWFNLKSKTVQVIDDCFGMSFHGLSLGPNDNVGSVTATDEVGNPSSTQVTIIRDDAKPEVHIASPANGEAASSANQVVTGVVWDTTITTAALYLNHVPREIPLAPLNDYARTFTVNVTLQAGVNTIEVRASDSAAIPNTGSSGLAFVTLDTSSPAIAVGLGDPANSVTVTVDTGESLAAAPVVLVDSTAVNMAKTGALRWRGVHGGMYSPISDGEYTVTANVTDRAGNETERTATFLKDKLTIAGNDTVTVQTGMTTIEFAAAADITDAPVSVTRHSRNPSGNARHPAGAGLSAGGFVEIVTSSELRDNLAQSGITLFYDPADLPATIDESTIRLYLWNVTSGTWQEVGGSSVNTTAHSINGTVTNPGIYGGFGAVEAGDGGNGDGGADDGGVGGGAGGGGGGGSTPIIHLVNTQGRLMEDVIARSDDRKVSLDLPKGTYCLSSAGSLIAAVRIKPLAAGLTPPTSPLDAFPITLYYNLGPGGATFVPPVVLTFKYDPDNIPAEVTANSLFITVWDPLAQQWERLSGTIDPENNTIRTRVGHFSLYTVMAGTRAAVFTLDDLDISTDEIEEGNEVTVSVLVSNGGDRSGTYEAALEVNGEILQTKGVTLDGGSSGTVSFNFVPDAPGEYSIGIGTLMGNVTVTPAEIISEPEISPAPASFAVSGLSISPGEAALDEEIVISVVVSNNGGTEGVHVVVLSIDGAKEASREVTVDAGASETVTFTASRGAEGTYTVEINGQNGEFTVLAPQPPVTEEVEALPVEESESNIPVRLLAILAGSLIILGILVFLYTRLDKNKA